MWQWRECKWVKRKRKMYKGRRWEMIVKSEFIPLSKHFLLRAWVGIFLIEKVLVNNSQDSPLAYHRQFLFASLNNLRLKKFPSRHALQFITVKSMLFILWAAQFQFLSNLKSYHRRILNKIYDFNLCGMTQKNRLSWG